MKKLNITKEFLFRAITVTVTSVVANVIALAIIRPVFNAPVTFDPFFYSSVVELTAGGVITAVAVYIVIGIIFPRRERNRDFTVVAIIALILSFIPDLTLPFSHARDNQGATWPIIGALMILHVIPALIVLWGLTRGVKEVESSSSLS